MGKKSVTETVSMFEAVDRECRPRLTDSQKRWLSAFGEHFRETSDEGLSYLYDAGLFSKTDWLSNYAAWNQMKTFQTHLGFSDIEKLIKASRKKKRLAISDIRPSLLSLPYRIVGLSGSLVELCITEVDLREFPLSVCSLENLTSLTVSKCPLTRIPAEVRRLSRLRKLEISWTRIADLGWLHQMPDLRQLVLSFNRIELVSTSALSRYPKLTYLSLERNAKLGLIDDGIPLPRIKGLRISETSILKLPRSIYSTIRVLEWSGCGEIRLPRCIAPSLKHLDVSMSLLQSFPPELSRSPLLRYVNVSNCGISPDGLKRLGSELHENTDLVH